MALVTFCPDCGVAFRVNATQLQMHNGDVRCGCCQQIFNGFSTLITVSESAIISSQDISLKSDVALETAVESSLPDLSEAAQTERSAQHLPHVQQDSLPQHQPQPLSRPQPHSSINLEMPLTQSDAPVTVGLTVQQTASQTNLILADLNDHGEMTESSTDSLLDDHEHSVSKWLQFFLGFANIMLLMLLFAQITYHYRTELTIIAPESRPILERSCMLLGCLVPYPQQIEQLGIETSDLQKSETKQPSTSTLYVVIRNHAPFPQALPLLQLSLLDAKDQLTANRVFAPREYLSNENQVLQFIEANDDLEIRLDFDNSQLDAFGYRLNLLYL
ncbi:MJ0042 family finger-like domain-containing protein [Nitrosomonas sp. PY1]|uniref:zinc-ribbon and DUF3426 domain-containing protein n=1 Tax=Nitrosomonas sp. PY1 TaxID=1803906 RepID=UPI001FC82CC1|nr:zinc-ribbon and DUF3426 domain-containing protein [Nitrosomonas sp. PY1]GKS68617.1 MJ0042 family finger-like domain-containing protein [Nitrosomonas sp. PY1]